jgi:hypothetical protein
LRVPGRVCTVFGVTRSPKHPVKVQPAMWGRVQLEGMLCGIYLESNRPTLDISLRHPTRLICGSLVVCAPYLASLEAQSIPLRSNQLCGGVFNLKACSVEFIWSQIALPMQWVREPLEGSLPVPRTCVHTTSHHRWPREYIGCRKPLELDLNTLRECTDPPSSLCKTYPRLHSQYFST